MFTATVIFLLSALSISVLIMLIAKLVNKQKSFSVIVDYDLPLGEMIAACKFDWVNDDINKEWFPDDHRTGLAKVDFTIDRLNKSIASEGLLQTLDKNLGFRRPATLKELLAFRAKHPNEQEKYCIAARGSVGENCIGEEVVAVARLDPDSQRTLFLHPIKGGWDNRFRFLTATIEY
jgi:hypothetical protein